MAEQYQVVGALAAFTVSDAEGGAQKLTFYKGNMVPQGVPQNEIEHNLSVKLIAKVGGDAEIPAMTGPLGDGTSRPPEGNALADPVPLDRAPTVVSPAVATTEQVEAGTGVALEQATGTTSQSSVDAKRAAARAKLPTDGSEPDGRASQAVGVEYLVARGSRYDDVKDADKTDLQKLAKLQA